MESFLVYLFNFYYAISELEQNKQNNTIIFFLLFIFLTKKWTSAVCGGGAGAPIAPPLPTGLPYLYMYIFYLGPHFVLLLFYNYNLLTLHFQVYIDPMQKWLPLNYSFVRIQNSLTDLVRDNKFFTIFFLENEVSRATFKYEQKNNIKAAIFA